MSANPSTIICVAAEWRVQPGHEAKVLELMQQAAATVRRTGARQPRLHRARGPHRCHPPVHV